MLATEKVYRGSGRFVEIKNVRASDPARGEYARWKAQQRRAKKATRSMSMADELNLMVRRQERRAA